MTPESFKRTFLPLGEKLYRVALRILMNPQDAEDAVQDTYVRMWELRSKLERMEKAEAYFMETLKNCCFSSLRDRHEEVELEEGAAACLDEAAEPEAASGDEIIGRLIGRLPARARTIVSMRHVALLEMKEIADLTGESEANVRAILSRSRRKLREQYVKAIEG